MRPAGSGVDVDAVVVIDHELFETSAGGTRMVPDVTTDEVARLARAMTWKLAVCGVPYAGALGVAPVVLRSDSEDGFLAVIFLFAIVWTTDVVAYFSGRAIGGPKLMAQVSPKKTWSGAIGGTLAAVVVAFVLAKVMALSGLFAIAMLAALYALDILAMLLLIPERRGAELA